MTVTTGKSNAELAREYVDDAMRGTAGTLTAVHGRDAVLTAANVLAVLATADAMRPAAPATVVNMGDHPLTETGRLVLQRQLDRAHDTTALPEYEVKVGDPDPTPPAGWGGERCNNYDGLFYCTARLGHSGQHVAGDDDEVVGVWS